VISITTSIRDEQFSLHPTGVAFCHSNDTLLIADVHLGKVSHFRKHGSAVPTAVLLENFDKLNLVIKEFQPKRILFLGDLFHSFSNSEWDFFAHWRMQQKLEIVLISGNHDIIDNTKYEALGVEVHEFFSEASFYYTHHPEIHTKQFNIAGHVHPGVRLKTKGRFGVNTPCFFISEEQMILPAFGVFTGKYILEPRKSDRIFALAGNEVIDVSTLFAK